MIGNALMLRDLGRMANEPVPQLGARVSHDPTTLEEAAFRDQHGMSRSDYIERQRQWARQDFEDRAVADLEGDPAAVNVPAGLSAARQAYYRFNRWLAAEEQKLSVLEAKKAEIEALISAPAEFESSLKALVRRSADRLLHGIGADESDATKRVELETKHAAQRHAAEAAKLALPELETQIDIAKLRVDRLRGREKEYLYPCVREASESAERLLERKRAEVAELERLLQPLWTDYRGYGAPEIETPRVEIRWKHSWSGIAAAVQSDPAADIGRMLPSLKGIQSPHGRSHAG